MKKLIRKYGVPLIFLLMTSTAFAAEIPERLAVKALIGEAGGQSNEEILAHAYALKNRGTLRGVYGLHATHTPNPTPEQWQRVEKAYWTAKLAFSDPLDGRTEWRSDYDLELIKKKGQTPEKQGLYDGLRVGETVFYRLKKGKTT